MKAKKFDQQFDKGVSVMASLDLSQAKRVIHVQKRINLMPSIIDSAQIFAAAKTDQDAKSMTKAQLNELIPISAVRGSSRSG